MPCFRSAVCSEPPSRSSPSTTAHLGGRAVVSTASGISSAKRNRFKTTTWDSSAIRRSRDSSLVASRNCAFRSLEEGRFPRLFISVEKFNCGPAGRNSGWSAMNVPDPRLRCTSRSFAKICTAWRAVIRLTLKRSASSASDGNKSPGWPSTTCSRSHCTICS